MEKPGALGVCLDDLWGCVQVLELHSAELLLGVPVDGERAGVGGAGTALLKALAQSTSTAAAAAAAAEGWM